MQDQRVDGIAVVTLSGWNETTVVRIGQTRPESGKSYTKGAGAGGYRENPKNGKFWRC
jgi:hypothetical protein